VFIAFFPKCPVCWAAYLSMFGITGLNSIPYSPWLVPVFIAVIGINLFALARGAKNRNGMLPFYLSLAGALFLTIPGLLLKVQAGLYAGIFLIFAGSLLNSLSFKTYIHLKRSIRMSGF
jgi:protein SCO1/2